MNDFQLDLEAIRERARSKMDDGAVTEGYRADREKVIEVLNEALATEIVCILRYKSHYFLAEGTDGELAAQEFLEHANEEQQHADMIAERITQLGGIPDMSPEGLRTKAHANYHNGTDLLEMIEEDLVAERIAIETYGAIIRWLGDDDPTTRRMMETILSQEEHHADDMASLRQQLARRGTN